jgi:hypothetical protein
MDTENTLCDLYTAWLAENHLPEMSADELLHELYAGMDSLLISPAKPVAETRLQQAWLSDFIQRWETVMRRETAL